MLWRHAHALGCACGFYLAGDLGDDDARTVTSTEEAHRIVTLMGDVLRRGGVVVALTKAEARGLSRAAGNVTSDPDALEAVYRTPQAKQAALRAHAKLDRALYRPRKAKKRKLPETVEYDL